MSLLFVFLLLLVLLLNCHLCIVVADDNVSGSGADLPLLGEGFVENEQFSMKVRNETFRSPKNSAQIYRLNAGAVSTGELHSCEFAESLCKWTIEGDLKPKFRPKPQRPISAAQKEQMNSEEIEDFWKDFVYFDLQAGQMGVLKSPLFKFEKKSIAKKHRHLASAVLANSICVAFCAQISSPTIEISLDQLEASKKKKQLWENNEKYGDGKWFEFFATSLPQGNQFELQFKIKVNHQSPSNVKFSLGYLTVTNGHCEQDLREGRLISKMIAQKNVGNVSDTLGILENPRMSFNPANTWPSGIIPYEIATDQFSASQRSLIRRGILSIHNLTCIRFVPRNNAEKYLLIQGESDGCFAYVGYYSSFGGLVNLQQSACVGLSTIQHELLHALGFLHEHQRPDRDDYVEITWENVDDSKAGNFGKYSSASVSTYNYDYDYESIMHYGPTAFTTNGKRTILSKFPWARINEYRIFSSLDYLRMNNLYDCNNVDANAAYLGECTVDRGDFICERYAPCEFGQFVCPLPMTFSSGSCITGKILGETCDGTNDVCSTTNSECSGGVCVCSTGYYEGHYSDCLAISENQVNGDVCVLSANCMYNLECLSSTCSCPDHMKAVGNYDCEKKQFGDSCSVATDCSNAIPMAECGTSSTCRCPSSYTADTYLDTGGIVRQACQLKSVTKAAAGESCDVASGLLCQEGLACRTCPNSLTDTCTLGPEFAVTFNSFPDKPVDVYIIDSSPKPGSRLQLIVVLTFFTTFMLQ